MSTIDKIEEPAANYNLSGQIIGLAMKVHAALGPGFLESVYQNALLIELRKNGFEVEQQKPITVRYAGEIVGAFLADLFIAERLIVELKAISVIGKAHEVQLVNCLTATGIDEGLLLNFGTARLEYKKKFRQQKIEPASF